VVFLFSKTFQIILFHDRPPAPVDGDTSKYNDEQIVAIDDDVEMPTFGLVVLVNLVLTVILGTNVFNGCFNDGLFNGIDMDS
jgi:hypothetical protein